jgi:hypothetical protein
MLRDESRMLLATARHPIYNSTTFPQDNMLCRYCSAVCGFPALAITLAVSPQIDVLVMSITFHSFGPLLLEHT